jgi:hypothetical protein
MNSREHSPQQRPGAAERRPDLWLMVALSVVSAVALFVFAGPPRFDIALLYWFVACVVGEMLWVRVPFGRTTISMASCFNFAAILVLPAGSAMLAAATASAIGEAVAMRKPALRVLYNASHTAVAVGAATLAFGAIQPPDRTLLESLSRLQVHVFVVPGLAYYALNRGAVSLAVAMSQRTTLLAAWRGCFGHSFEWISTGGIFSLGALLATHYTGIGMAGTLLVILPLVLAFDGLRRYWRSQEPSSMSESAEHPVKAA